MSWYALGLYISGAISWMAIMLTVSITFQNNGASETMLNIVMAAMTATLILATVHTGQLINKKEEST